MIAEVISIGDELSSGQRLDTNSQWLSQQLGDLGIQVMYHTTVGDDLDANVRIFREAAQRANIVISTGGLGPTADDLTREAMARAFSRDLQLDPASLEHIENLFAKRKRPMPERNRVQALFPEGTWVIPNPHGSAPGIDLTITAADHRCRLFALPGVPAEMKEMFLLSIKERLLADETIEAQTWYYQTIKLFGIGESDVEVKLPNLIARDRVPRVGITVSQATITLRMAAAAGSLEEANLLMQSTRQEIYDCFGDLIFGEGDIDLEDAVIQALAQRNESVAIVEVGPTAWVCDALLRADALSTPRVRGGLHFRNEEEIERGRQRLNPKQLIANGCPPTLPDPLWNVTPTQEVVEKWGRWQSMATQVQQWFDSDWVLWVAGYPETSTFREKQRLPIANSTVGILKRNHSMQFRTWELGAHPDVMMARIGKTAIDQLRRCLRDT